MEPEIEGATDLLVTAVAVAASIVVALLVGVILSAVVRRAGRRNELMRDLSYRLRRPDRAVLLVVAVWLAVRATTDASTPWLPAVEHLLLIALIVVVAWWVGAFAFVLEDSALQRFRVDNADNRHARRVRTQITVVRRLTVAVIVVCGIAGVLLTFDAARAAGASLLASAGLISIVAGLAAQTSLANVFAGMQIAFTDAIRVDDVVVLEGEWGRIEEITMTYVVVHLWDDRRLIMPSTYFTTTPFQNWTRRAADLLGTVELDLDFTAPVGAMRAELRRLLSLTELWDERVGILQVTDAVGGYVRVRALVSASDAPTLFDLRCFVREGLVDWLQRAAPGALPRYRLADAWSLLPDDAGSATGHEPSSPGGDGTAPAVGTAPAADLPVPPARPPRLPTNRGALRADAPVVVGRLRAAGGGTRAGARPDDDRTELLPAQDGARTDEEVPEAAESAFFSGTAEGEERSRAFAGPGHEAIEERERTAENAAVREEEWREVGPDGAAADGDSAHDEAADRRPGG
ncbi:mechanosensitive ion channel family protein [Cellulosimicrobium arenosum]|uniref:Mechanosensitive ion channel n=1 Tax=Cellulosimicrobium arenosum TaxID=2708133 RepID=A0A927IZU2_9MICO|nr:mechanosensitive ion channel family protein [Cellulosimicrobium arenosum]MBD8078832.1 mechanosensitive ion channel [Cellulosimicrobium arenosum]